MSTSDPSWGNPEHLAKSYTPVFQLEPADGTVFGQIDSPDYPEVILSQIDIHGIPEELAMDIEAGRSDVVGTILAVDNAGRLAVNNQAYPALIAVGEIVDRNGRPTKFRINSFTELDLFQAI